MPFNWTEIDQKFTNKGLSPLDATTKIEFDESLSFEDLNQKYNDLLAQKNSTPAEAKEEIRKISKAINPALLKKSGAQTALENLPTIIETIVNSQTSDNQALMLHLIMENIWTSLPLVSRLNILSKMMTNANLVNLTSIVVDGSNIADIVLPSVTDFSAITIADNPSASISQNNNLFKFIFPKVQNPNLRDKDGNNALTIAVRQNIPSLVQDLLIKGAIVNPNDHSLSSTLIKNFYKSTIAISDLDGPTEITLSLWLTGSFSVTGDMRKFINNIPQENIHTTPKENGYSLHAENAVKIIKLLSSNGLDINSFDANGMNLFCLASDPIFVNNSWMIEQIMSLPKFNINAATIDGANLFTWACNIKKSDLALKIITDPKFNLDITIQKHGPLLAKLEGPKANEILDILLSKGQDINAQDQKGQTLFYFACQNKNIDLALKIASHPHFDVSIVNSHGENPLIIALDNLSDVRILDALAARSTPLAIKNFQGYDAFTTAIYHGKLEMAKWIHSKIHLNNPITSDNGIYPVHLAIQKSNIEIITWLLAVGYSANQTSSNDKKLTPLRLAKALSDDTPNKAAIIDLLTSRGAVEVVEIEEDAANIQDKNGKTPFMMLCNETMDDQTQIELLGYQLEDQEFDATIVDNQGKGPIHYATFLSDANGAKTIINGCVAKGADINARDCQGRTPLSEAIYSGRPDMAITLLNLDADPMIPDNNGAYPIHIAAGFGQIATLETLFTKGVDVNYPSSNHLKDTPILIAKKHAPADLKDSVVQWLLAHGARDFIDTEILAQHLDDTHLSGVSSEQQDYA